MLNIIKSCIKNQKTYCSILGYLGVIPFLLASLFIWTNIWNTNYANISEFVVLYATIIFVFIGGIYWGIAIKKKQNSFSLFTFSILPTILIIFLNLFTNMTITIKIIIIIFLYNLFLMFELPILKSLKIVKWFYILRIRLNILVTFFLILICIKLN